MYKQIEDKDALMKVGDSFQDLKAEEMQIDGGGVIPKPISKLVSKATRFTGISCYVGASITLVSYTITTRK